MSTVKKQFQGVSLYRYSREPLEKEFTLAWQHANESRQGQPTGIMDYMFDPDNQGRPRPTLTDRDHLVAASVVQWLGSHVGQNFLATILSKKEAEYFRSRLQDKIDGKP